MREREGCGGCFGSKAVPHVAQSSSERHTNRRSRMEGDEVTHRAFTSQARSAGDARNMNAFACKGWGHLHIDDDSLANRALFRTTRQHGHGMPKLQPPWFTDRAERLPREQDPWRAPLHH